MHYYIDGYNLMFRTVRAGSELQEQREQIIHDISRVVNLLNLDATIVFDAQYREGLGGRSHLEQLEVCFTDEGETADDYIITELRSSPTPRQEVVVTSDGKLAWRARRLLAKTETIDEFMRWTSERYRKKLREVKQQQRPRKKKVLPPPPKETKAFSPEHPPLPGKTPEESFDYYHYTFEKNVPEPPPVEETESELERWQRLFEKRLKEDEKDSTDF